MSANYTEIIRDRDKVIADVKTLIADSEELLHATASQAGERAAAARARVQESVKAARNKLLESQAALLEDAKVAAHATDDYVHKHPWSMAGAAAAIGVVIGLLLRRR
jgi:ElaB/YqjD/DUF883 family membrane-anchored ribosome-binding protein